MCCGYAYQPRAYRKYRVPWHPRWDRIDVLAFECHARRGRRSCADLMARVRAAAPHLKLYQEDRDRLPDGRVYFGFDSESTPKNADILAMVQSCGLVPPGSAAAAAGAAAAAAAGNFNRTRHGTPHTAARHKPLHEPRAPRPRVNIST